MYVEMLVIIAPFKHEVNVYITATADIETLIGEHLLQGFIGGAVRRFSILIIECLAFKLDQVISSSGEEAPDIDAQPIDFIVAFTFFKTMYITVHGCAVRPEGGVVMNVIHVVDLLGRVGCFGRFSGLEEAIKVFAQKSKDFGKFHDGLLVKNNATVRTNTDVPWPHIMEEVLKFKNHTHYPKLQLRFVLATLFNAG